MAVHHLAGASVPESMRINVPRLISDYYTLAPDPSQATACHGRETHIRI